MDIKATVSTNHYCDTKMGYNRAGEYVLSGMSTYEVGGLTKLEHMMLELTKALLMSNKYYSGAPTTEVVNRAQELFETLKQRIEDIEQKGLLSDDKHERIGVKQH